MSRVLLDARVGVGGVGRYYSILSAALAHDPELDVFAVAPTEAAWARPFTPWGRAHVSRVGAALGADVIHGLHLEAPRTHRPLVVTIHDTIPLDHPAAMPSRLRRAVFRRLLAAAIERADRIIVPSSATASALMKRGAALEQISVVPNAVAESFAPCSEAEREASRRRFARGSAYVAAVSGAKAHKNFPLVRAVAAALSQNGVVTACAGGPAASAESVIILGPLGDDDLRMFYCGAEALLVPSLIEGFGFPVVEALACGTPVVCGQNVGALEFAGPGIISVDVGQPGEVVSALRRLIAEPEMRAELAVKGRAAVASLTPARQAAETKAVYKELL